MKTNPFSEEVNQMWFMHNFGGWWMLFGGMWMIVFWAAIIGVIIWGITRLTRHDGSTLKQKPIDIARERYARGDITREEFEQIKKDLY